MKTNIDTGELRHKDIWEGLYNGIRYRVVRWSTPHKWNYYIYIPMDRVPKHQHDQIDLEPHTRYSWVAYDNYKSDILSNLDLHGGCTYYHKHGGIDGLGMVVEVGCDYSHYYDEGIEYHIDIVSADARHSIDKLWELMPDLKVWCRCSGKLYQRDQGEMREGSFYSNEYTENRKSGTDTPVVK